MNKEGTILASASEKGTRIRIFNCINGVLLQEFKRGSEKAEINYITFDNLGILVAVTSDRGTIHIWSIKNSIKKLNDIINDNKKNNLNNNNNDNSDNSENNNNNIQDNLPENKSSIFNFFGVKTERSFAQIRLADEHLYKFAFLTNNNIIAISYFGKYIYAILNTKKGDVCNIDESGFLSEKKFDK